MKGECMKRHLMMMLSFGLLLSNGITHAQTSFYDTVSQFWWSGQKQAVLSIAQQRLQNNPNDIAGLILRLEYEVAFIDMTSMATTAARIIEVGSGITTKNFRAKFPQLKLACKSIGPLLSELYGNLTPQQIEEDRAKGNIPNKPMALGFAIKALQDDGFFQ